MGLGLTWMILNFESHLDQCLDTFPHLLTIMYLGGGHLIIDVRI